MATVKMSGTLRETMVKNAQEIFEVRIRLVENESPVHGDEIWDCMFSQYQTHIDGLPDFMYDTKDSINVRSIEWVEEAFDRVKDVSIDKRFALSEPKPFFSRSDSSLGSGCFNYDGYRYSSWRGLTIDASHHAWKPIVDKLTTWADKLESIRAEQNEYRRIVSRIVDAYNTLAPLLKEYPALWDLVPQETKDRHLVVPEKRKATKVELDVDVNKINAITARAKLTGGL